MGMSSMQTKPQNVLLILAGMLSFSSAHFLRQQQVQLSLSKSEYVHVCV